MYKSNLIGYKIPSKKESKVYVPPIVKNSEIKEEKIIHIIKNLIGFFLNLLIEVWLTSFLTHKIYIKAIMATANNNTSVKRIPTELMLKFKLLPMKK